jgi:ketosteroid isomerase-like protein
MVTEKQFGASLQRILDALNAQDWDALDGAVDALFAADYVWHLPGARPPVRGPEEVKQVFRFLVNATPGYKATIEDLVAAETKSAARLRVRRTDPETGKSQQRTSIMINHLEGDKFVTGWQLASEWEDEA